MHERARAVRALSRHQATGTMGLLPILTDVDAYYTMCPRSVHSDKQAVLALYSVENVGEKARLPISVALL